MTTRALVFDFDGLLVETEGPVFHAWRGIYEDHGLELTLDEWAVTIGRADHVDPMDELERRLGRPVDRDDVNRRRKARRDAMLEAQGACAGVPDILEDARRLGLAIGIASSSPPDWVESHLERLDLTGHFTYVSCFDGRCPAKPEPDLYLRALDGLGVRAGEAVAFEDSHNGLLAAKAAGIPCVVVPTEMTAHMDFELADLVVPKLGEPPLEEVLERIGARPLS